MEMMDAWTKFFQTGNVLDYLRYSAIRDAQRQFDVNGAQDNEHDNSNTAVTFNDGGAKS